MGSLSTLLAATTYSSVEGSKLLIGIILLAGLGTGSLFVASVFAYAQRQSIRYFFITAAVGALFLRSFVGFGTVMGHVPMLVHHTVEHTFDFMIAALILSAVYRSKPNRLQKVPSESPAKDGHRGKEQ